LRTLLESFEAGAYDQVPFQLADENNKHTNDPERTRGEIQSLDLAADGLYMTISTTKQGAKVIQENPRLGVSARIVNQLKRADGKFFPAAIQHALGTLDPRINGLGSWSAVEASNDDGPFIDLTGTEYQEASSVADKLTAEEQAQLDALLAKLGDDAPDSDNDDEDELTDAELEALMLEADSQDEDAGGKSTEDDDDLSEEEIERLIATGQLDLEEVNASVDQATQQVLEMTRSQVAVHNIELARVTEALDEGRWQQERTMFMEKYGIPPSILDLAKPVLKGDGHVISLSNGDNADSGAIVRRMLTEIGTHVKMLDLSNELGTAIQQDATDQEHEQTLALVKNYRSQTGI
jgi:hypothetical protein